MQRLGLGFSNKLGIVSRIRIHDFFVWICNWRNHMISLPCNLKRTFVFNYDQLKHLKLSKSPDTDEWLCFLALCIIL